MVVPQRVAAALVLLLLLSGCAGAAPKSNGGTTSVAPAAVPTASGEMGSITGTIQDEEARPIVAAEIALLKTEFLTKSDAAGKFTFNDLAPGTYTVAIGRLGFSPFAQAVNVVAGEVVELPVTLTAVEVYQAPIVRTVPFNGFLQCSANPLYFVNPCGDAIGKNIDHTKIELDAALPFKGLMLELVWTPSFPGTSDELELDICEPATDASATQTGCLGHAANDEFYEYTSDPSPLVANYTAEDLPEGAKTFEVWIGAGLGLYPLSFQQAFTLYVTTCYVTECPKGTTGRPPAA